MLFDIGANLTDHQYQGKYNHSDKATHEPDLEVVLRRAAAADVGTILVTGGNAEESLEAIALCRAMSSTDIGGIKLHSTVGCHPTRCTEFLKHRDGPDAYYEQLRKTIAENRDVVLAIGECGLDYDRTHFCPIEVQKQFFPVHFMLAQEFGLPMFLHDRNTGDDFLNIMRENRSRFREGVVHSFTGTMEEMEALVALDLYIGINGCSLKTEENLAVAAAVPLERLLLETDAPWCDIRPTHASHVYVATKFDSVKKEKYTSTKLVKGRNEPCTMVQVLEVVHGLHAKKGSTMTLEGLKEIVIRNSLKFFGMKRLI
eukprot:PhM_4_TR13561/c0_g1_i1/m.38681/K03424/tatD; TatD DNase family protein